MNRMTRSASNPTNLKVKLIEEHTNTSKNPSIRVQSTNRKRPYSAYTKLHDTVNSIDTPASNREQWWRAQLRETPVSTRYHIKDFVQDISDRNDTYHFRDVGREKVIPSAQTHGGLLLPGAYHKSRYPDDYLSSNRFSYNFRSVERDKLPKLGHGHGDKEVDVPPNQYDVVSYTPSVGNKDSVFRSTIQREPFRGKIGPAPGQYHNLVKGEPLSSSYMFKSRVPRLMPSTTRVPGPGSYNPKDVV